VAEHEIGVISDTHGLLRPEVTNALCGVERIIHAGDIGNPDLLDQLENIAPVVAVRGNVDRGLWSETLPDTQVVQVGDHYLYVLHDLNGLDLDPVAAGFSAVIFGHTHHPLVEWKQNVLYLNPGSAGPRRFSLPVSLARLSISGANLTARLIELDV